MRRTIRFLLGWALLPLSAALGHAQDLPADTRLSSWATTIIVAQPKAPPSKSIVTGAIPKPRAMAPNDGLGPPRHELEGIASFYWQDQMTANGERFDKTAMTAAHRTLPFGTRVRVTNLQNGQAVVVRINDRGPFKAERVIDLSDAAAEALGFRARGLTKVKVEVVQ
jgi:rare lipoprotein A